MVSWAKDSGSNISQPKERASDVFLDAIWLMIFTKMLQRETELAYSHFIDDVAGGNPNQIQVLFPLP